MKTRTPNVAEFTFKVEGNGHICQLKSENYPASVLLEIKDGEVLLHTREYIRGAEKVETLLSDVKEGQDLKVSVSLNEKALLIVKVNSKTLTRQLNTPSYRDDLLEFKQTAPAKARTQLKGE